MRMADGALQQHASGRRPPIAADNSSASAQPPTLPGTVSAACGPRGGNRFDRRADSARCVAFSPAKPQASIARTLPFGSRISQKPSPPIAFICG